MFFLFFFLFFVFCFFRRKISFPAERRRVKMLHHKSASVSKMSIDSITFPISISFVHPGVDFIYTVISFLMKLSST